MALLERLPSVLPEQSSFRERFATLPGVRRLVAHEVQAPTIHVLQDLAATVRQTEASSPEDTAEIVLQLDSVAEQYLEVIEDKQYSTLSEVWAAANAWDAARLSPAQNDSIEHVESLMDLVIERRAALAAREALSAAYHRAKQNGTLFSDELDTFNAEQRAVEKQRVQIN